MAAGYAVLLPPEHLCCGYPLLAAGAHDAFAENQDRNISRLKALAEEAAAKGFPVGRVLTSCGSCRDGMERHFIPQVFPSVDGNKVELSDVAWFLMHTLPPAARQDAGSAYGTGRAASCALNGKGAGKKADADAAREILYHSPCHAEVPGLHKVKAGKLYAAAAAEHLGLAVRISPDCCGESGLGAMTSPAIYNKIRGAKTAQLERDLADMDKDAPVVVGCPSCKMGISRILLQQDKRRRVLHLLEFTAERLMGRDWRKKCAKLLAGTSGEGGLRRADMAGIPDLQLSDAENRDADDEHA